jgi:OOP family OmpA-OmpF porin
MVMKQVLTGMLVLSSVLVLAQTPQPARVLQTASARVDVLGQVHRGAVGVHASQARIVVYAPEDLRLSGATSFFVNGTYHASIIKGAYSELCLKPGTLDVGLRQMEVGQRPKDLPDNSFALQVAAGQLTYLRIREQGGLPQMQIVAAEQALRELAGKREQVHTISRIAQACIDTPVPVVAAAPVAPPPEAPKRLTLAADTLFATARSDRNGITSEGLSAIEGMVGRVNQEYSRIDAVRIIGHADPLGNAAQNERLAQERANTIRQFFEAGLQQRVPITAEGRGSREPVVSNCARQSTPASRLCNQPNRRVDIEVTGVRR